MSTKWIVGWPTEWLLLYGHINTESSGIILLNFRLDDGKRILAMARIAKFVEGCYYLYLANHMGAVFALANYHPKRCGSILFLDENEWFEISGRHDINSHFFRTRWELLPKILGY